MLRSFDESRRASARAGGAGESRRPHRVSLRGSLDHVCRARRAGGACIRRLPRARHRPGRACAPALARHARARCRVARRSARRRGGDRAQYAPFRSGVSIRLRRQRSPDLRCRRPVRPGTPGSRRRVHSARHPCRCGRRRVCRNALLARPARPRDAHQRAHPALPRDPAFWLYSSGTTGKPKGIIHSHKDVLSAGQIYGETLALAPGDRVFVTSKLFFAYALDHGFLGSLAHGLTAVLHPDWPDIDEACEIVAREQPAVFASVPSFYRRLAALPDRQARTVPCRALFPLGRRADPGAAGGALDAGDRRRAAFDLWNVGDIRCLHGHASRACRRSAAWKAAARSGGPARGKRGRASNAGRAGSPVGQASRACARVCEPARSDARAVLRRLVLHP